MSTGVRLQAIIQNIRTTVDGGWRVSFDIAQERGTAVTIAELSALRDRLLTLEILPPQTFLIEPNGEAGSDEASESDEEDALELPDLRDEEEQDG